MSRPSDHESSAGFHFFGTPIKLPSLPDEPAEVKPIAAQAPADRSNFVDVFAARHSLLARARMPDKNVPARTAVEPASAKDEELTSDDAPAPTLAQAVSDSHTLGGETYKLAMEKDGKVDSDDPASSTGDDDLLASPAPILEAPTLEAPTLKEKPTGSPARFASMPNKAGIGDEPLVAVSPLAISDVTLADAGEEIKGAPAPTVPGQKTVPEEASTASQDEDNMDLTERERAFVLALAQAAGSGTPADGEFNHDRPSSGTISATPQMEQIPAETVTTFRVDPSTAETTLNSAVVQEESSETGSGTKPASAGELPDSLPSFAAPTTGKIDIQSDRQADHDLANNKVIYTGKVELNSAAIRLRADRIEVFLKEGGGTMERVEASGNVVMRTRDTANAPGQMASAGRASYIIATGGITLSDWPKIQESRKAHISTDPSTKMYLFTDGRMHTDGPNRTILGGN